MPQYIHKKNRRNSFWVPFLVVSVIAITTTTTTLLVRPVHAADVPPLHSRLFPPNDEYDGKILDPTTMYGSPYGGFSRATRSRLAALPLRLPDVKIMENINNNDSDHFLIEEDHSPYMHTTDGQGRSYVCRVYQQDELTPTSVDESVFDSPVVVRHKQKQTTTTTPTGSDTVSGMEHDVEDTISLEDEDANGQDSDDDTADHQQQQQQQQPYSDDVILMETQRRLKKLDGVCSQIHLGWWSYEWCYDQVVTQFHIHVDSVNAELELRDVTSLGKFTSRKFHIPHKKSNQNDDVNNDDDDDDDDFTPVNKFAEDEPELARVVDTFQNGDICDATGHHRQTKVKYFCCSDRLIERYKGPVLRNGNPLASKIVSIVSLVEDPDQVCTYTIALCTPLLCEDVKSDDDDSLLFDISTESMLHNPGKKRLSSSSGRRQLSSRGGTTTHKKSSLSSTSKKGAGGGTTQETIRDVLDRTLGTTCVRSTTSGWWSYEYCHRKHVRQFHESISINMETGVASASTGDVYMLGFYSEELDSYPDDEEWKYVVNTTLSSPGGSSSSNDGSSSSSANGGSGNRNNNAGGGSGSSGGASSPGVQSVAAYFMTEYVGGDVCDDSDVTDAAIKAGTVGGGHIERASTIRYACGSNYDIYVNEDHTCHYLVDITIPELCYHPFFKAPVAKKRVVKCLPVEDTSEWDTT